jgi:hypothetical protein
VSYFDDNNLGEISEENLRFFYEEFSSDVRRRLMSKNLIAPNSVYDVLYPQTRDALVAKNIPVITDLEKNNQSIRDAILAKNIYQNYSLEKASEDTRKAILARNKITTEADQILKRSAVVRDDLLSKNETSKNDILKDSEGFRNNNTSKNKPNLNAQNEAELNNDTFRQNNISANVKSESNIEEDSSEYRRNNLSLNVESRSDLEKDSVRFRENNTSSNSTSASDIESSSSFYRDQNIASNVSKNTNLEVDSESFFNKNISLNVKSESDIDKDSKDFRDKNVSQNVSSQTDIEKDSQVFRNNNVSKNTSTISDIEKESEQFRYNNVSKNTNTISDIENDSKQFRENNLSKNTPTTSDLESESKDIRYKNLSLNTPTTSDIESDSKTYLKDNLSLNTPTTSDIESDSKTYLKDNLSLNTPATSDIATDSVPFYNSNVAANVPSSSDLATDSVPFYNDNVAANVPSSSDLATDSVPFYNSNVAANVPSSSDLATDSVPFYNDNVAANVPSSSDLATDSVPFYNDNVAANVPSSSDLATDSVPFYNDNVAANVPSSSDLATDSVPFYNSNISANISSPIDLESYSNDFRDDLLSANVPTISSLEENSERFRKYNLSKNTPSKQLGVVIEGIGTSAFLGVSNVLLQGVLLRQILLSRNIRGILSIDTYAQEKQNQFLIESSNETINTHRSLQTIYGTSTSSVFGTTLLNGTTNGYITDAIRNYNISRNYYNIKDIQPFNADYYNILQTNTNEGFQALLASTPNSFVIRNLNFSQLAPSGNYTYKNPEEVFAANELMSKTTAGNPLMDAEFEAGTKGVLGIIRKIRDSRDSIFSRNYNVQDQTEFVVGMNGAQPRISRQRYTVSNPYSAGSAKKVLFYIQNYSSGDGYYFPPYIQDYSESFAANWNAINYLGRPESIYTYNNSSREGTITFVVLTDFSNGVLLGTNFGSANMESIRLTEEDLKGTHFTNRDSIQNKNKRYAQNSTEQKNAKIQEIKAEIETAIKFGKTTNDPGTQDINNKDIEELKREESALLKSVNNSFTQENRPTNYSETNGNIYNVYNETSTNPTPSNFGISESIISDTKQRINAMVKNLAFQPAFFSGDKVDFVTKMDFLGKLTRPSSAKSNSGFSFTRPPVCHIKLGDWWDSDIIIDSVSFNMTNAPWTLDGGRVQPMWATVSINFKFVGSYGSSNGLPVLSDDVSGFYAPKGKNLGSIK